MADYDDLVAFEERLIHRLGTTAEVDGHDFGSGELNIFVLTDDPVRTSTIAEDLRQQALPGLLPVIAYRELASETYVVLSPPGYTDFQLS